MMEMLILAGLVYCGYADAPGWLAPMGAVAMTVAGWWRKVTLLRQHPQVPFSPKMTTYLVVSIVINVIYAATAVWAGRALRLWTSG